ncbi:response regulator [Photobacterium sp. MCCC 1A19761]|uniref:response regulator n=1 Tax=Photobacterium sp. MCCC 1A19761 TaxID=3115000 RepID=UPI00307DCFD7
MLNNPIKINQHLYFILMDEQFDNFTVVEMRDAYLSSFDNDLDKNEARKIIYRQILRLQKRGLLEKNGANNARDSRYKKTALFYQSDLKPHPKGDSPARQISNHDHISECKDPVIHQLKERLKQCEVDLLTSIGESEEYMRLYESFPEMKEHLESQYLQARENSSKLLGQIKAIKIVLAHQKKL